MYAVRVGDEDPRRTGLISKLVRLIEKVRPVATLDRLVDPRKISGNPDQVGGNSQQRLAAPDERVLYRCSSRLESRVDGLISGATRAVARQQERSAQHHHHHER